MNFIKDDKNTYHVSINNKYYCFNKDHVKYDDLVENLKTDNIKDFLDNINTGQVIEDWSEGNFKIVCGIMRYNDQEIPQVLSERMIEQINDGWNYKPMMEFVISLYRNTSYRSINQLYGFLAHRGIPITDNGRFRAYKKVKIYRGEPIVDKNGNKINDGDYVDVWTGKSYRNNVGDRVYVDRNLVDDNPNNTCSDGLHVGALSYVKDYNGDKIVIVEVDPADVVSVPTDHNATKIRVCGYTVIAEFEGEMVSTVVSSDIEDGFHDDEDEFDDDYDDYEEEDAYNQDDWGT